MRSVSINKIIKSPGNLCDVTADGRRCGETSFTDLGPIPVVVHESSSDQVRIAEKINFSPRSVFLCGGVFSYQCKVGDGES